MGRPDNVEQLALDHSASDFSAAGSIAAAVIDVNAQTALVDCLNVETVDVIVNFSNLGTGPLTKVSVVGRSSAQADPDVTVATDWATINTENINTTSGISAIVPYVGEIAVGAVGSVVVSFPVRGRYFSALVWVDAAPASRGQVFTFRRGMN